MYRSILAIITLLLSTNAVSAVTTVDTTVKEIYSYSLLGEEGDVIFTVNDPISECRGFWLDSTSPGFKNNYSALLSAYHSGSTILVYADETKTFPNSSAKYCKLTIFRLRPR